MHIQLRFWRRLAIVWSALLSLLLLMPGAALAASYLPLTPGELKAEDKAVVAAPAPVQLLFQFKTKGAPNPQATKFLAKPVEENVVKSGFFSKVSTTGPVEGGAVLSITLENIPQEGALEKGFATGLTFGLAGTTVIDYYVLTVEYIPAPGAAKVTKEGKHQIITTIGLTKAPEGVVKAKNINEAVLTMTRQIISHGLNDLAKDPGFTVAAATVADPEVAPVPETAPEPAPAAPAEPDPATAPPAAPPASGGRR